MKTISDIVKRQPRPAPWSEGENIPWDDPAFSERILAEHLSQEHDLASRKIATIDKHVDWIFSTGLEGRPSRLLDFTEQGREKHAMIKYSRLDDRVGLKCATCTAPCLEACPHGVNVRADLMGAHGHLTLV